MAREVQANMSVSGIVQNPETQSRVIPESRRADGSIRKERKVKPGFTPAEDVGRFRSSRAMAAQEQQQVKQIPGYETVPLEAARKAMARTTLSSPASPSRADGDWRSVTRMAVKGGVSSSSSRDKVSISSSSASDSTNWRRKETQIEKVPDDWEKDEVVKSNVAENPPLSTVKGTVPKSIADEVNKDEKHLVPIEDGSIEEEDTKKARNLKKKVRAAQALQEKHKQSGEPLLPEQQAKVDLLDEMVRDLKALGVGDSQG